MVANHLDLDLVDSNLDLVESGHSFHRHDVCHLLDLLFHSMTCCFPALLFFHVALLLFVYHVAFAVLAAVVAAVNHALLGDCEGLLGVNDVQV